MKDVVVQQFGRRNKRICFETDLNTRENAMKFIKELLKIISAGIVSVAIVCGLLCFYDIKPIHKENPKRNTDYVCPPNSIWVKATEGIAFGKNDANGFNNKSVVDNPDIIVLGSSHMEAVNVMQDKNTAYLLSKKLNGKYSLYNMGVSGHDFFKVCQYLPANLELYDRAPKLVIIETSTVNISQSNVDEVIESSVYYTPSHNTGIIGILQRVPFFRTLYHQIKSGLLNLFMPDSAPFAAKTNNIEKNKEVPAPEEKIDSAAYKELFSYLKEMEDKYGTQIIIFYHPAEKLMGDGTVFFDSNKYLDTFKSFACEYEISFIDMTDRFEEMYYNDNHVPHGFCTGLLADGHINKYGHAAIADKLYDEIIKLEEAGELCR